MFYNLKDIIDDNNWQKIFKRFSKGNHHNWLKSTEDRYVFSLNYIDEVIFHNKDYSANPKYIGVFRIGKQYLFLSGTFYDGDYDNKYNVDAALASDLRKLATIIFNEGGTNIKEKMMSAVLNIIDAFFQI